MNQLHLLSPILAAGVLSIAQPSHGADFPWQPLFNGRDLSGFDTYLAPPAEGQPPLGLNHDPKGVFKVIQEDGHGVIHISGEIYGALTTHASFTNHHIRLQYRWGKAKWPPRHEPRHHRDSGILYWATGPHGAGSAAWMRSVEYNVMEKGMGQWWSVDHVICDVEGRKVVLEKHPSIPYRGESPGEECVVWEPGAPRYTVKPWEGITSPLDPELPNDQWNTAEVYAWGNTGIHLLNGQVVLVISNPRHLANGVSHRLSHGRIQLQSEAAELFYRSVEARPIDSLPAHLLPHVPVEAPDDTGFEPLLTGPAAQRWAQAGPGSFTLKDGIATGHGGMGLWWYQGSTYTNFILRGEWRQAGSRSDSGVFFRFPNPGNDPWIAVRQGHEFEIGEPRPAKPEEATGSFYPFHPPTLTPPVKPVGQWNTYELLCIGPNYSLRINNTLVNTWTDPGDRPLSGHIGLQNYNYPDRVEHRNLRIRPLPDTEP